VSLRDIVSNVLLNILSEDSLKELKNTIRAKLGLEPGVAISLSQIRGNSVVVLEDGESVFQR
jgi:hypothetical protein